MLNHGHPGKSAMVSGLPRFLVGAPVVGESALLGPRLLELRRILLVKAELGRERPRELREHARGTATPA